MLEKYLNITHGLELDRNINKEKRHNENGILFLSEYLVLAQYLNTITSKERDQFRQVCINLRTWKGNSRMPGLFDRGQDESKDINKFTRKISHDNLTAISRVSNDLSLPFNNAIATHFIQNRTLFDNAQAISPRLLYKSHTGKTSTTSQFHPRDWFYWLFMGGHKVKSIFFFPVFFISQILVCFTPKTETSGKMLLWTRLLGRKEFLLKFTWKICDFLLKRQYKTNNWIIPITDIYFPKDFDHPVRAMARQIKDLK